MPNMATIKSYSYEGPIQLGSIVAHHAGAAGLFVAHPAQVVLEGSEEDQAYQLKVTIEGKLEASFKGDKTAEGRRSIGHDLLSFLRIYQGLNPYGDWGTMVGVRPTKFLHKAMNSYQVHGLNQEDCLARALADMKEIFHVSADKRELLASIVSLQRPLVGHRLGADRHISVYGGIPFCQTRCSYCSFPYGLIQDYGRVDQFIGAFKRDADHLKDVLAAHNLTVDSLYLGGGTPTAVNDGDFEQVLEALDGLLKLGREYTVEAGRPDSVSPDKLASMLRHGVNRISINPQTLQDPILKAIGRGHRAQDIKDLYQFVKKTTDLVVNMDFIAGLPGQTYDHMVENMDYICEALPENVTIHTLALKKGSPLYEGKGLDQVASESQVEDMVAYARERLLAMGYEPYYLYRQQYMRGQLENIGYSLPGKACQYNIHMMEEAQSILSIGPGSSSKWMRYPDYRQRKQHMPKNVDVYIDTLDQLLNKRKHISDTFWEVL